MAHFRGANAEGERPEGAMGGGMAVATDNRHPRLGRAQFRAHHMHDTAIIAAPAMQRDGMGGGIRFEHLDLELRRLGGIGRRLAGAEVQRRRRMIDRRQGAVRTAHFQTARGQGREGLRRGHFMDQMQVDIEHARRPGGFRRDLVAVPDFFEQGTRRAVVRRHAGPPCHCHGPGAASHDDPGSRPRTGRRSVSASARQSGRDPRSARHDHRPSAPG